MTAADLIKKLPAALVPSAAADMDCIIQFNVSTPMYATIKDGSCDVHEGKSPTPDIAVGIEDADLVALMTGELNAMTAFMTGKLQVEGDLMLAQRLTSLFDKSKLV